MQFTRANAIRAATMAQNVVCYHYPCIDGVYSALAAHLHFKQKGEAARFFPLTVYKKHSVEELQLQGTETVYMCDFHGPDGFAVGAAKHAERLLVLDHHKTAFEALQGMQLPPNMELHMDMHRSGATIALGFFKPEVSEALQTAYRFVEDADLWRWQQPGSREFNAGLGALNLEFDVNKNPGIFDELQGLSLDAVMASGKLAIEEQDNFIASALGSAFRVQLGGGLGIEQGWGMCLAVEIDESMGKHRSRLGNELAELSAKQGLEAIGIIAYREVGMEDPSAIKLSLRGKGDETDTTPISQAFGGGGHRLASSCTIPMDAFDSWKV